MAFSYASVCPCVHPIVPIDLFNSSYPPTLSMFLIFLSISLLLSLYLAIFLVQHLVCSVFSSKYLSSALISPSSFIHLISCMTFIQIDRQSLCPSSLLLKSNSEQLICKSSFLPFLLLLLFVVRSFFCVLLGQMKVLLIVCYSERCYWAKPNVCFRAPEKRQREKERERKLRGLHCEEKGVTAQQLETNWKALKVQKIMATILRQALSKTRFCGLFLQEPSDSLSHFTTSMLYLHYDVMSSIVLFL